MKNLIQTHDAETLEDYANDGRITKKMEKIIEKQYEVEIKGYRIDGITPCRFDYKLARDSYHKPGHHHHGEEPNSSDDDAALNVGHDDDMFQFDISKILLINHTGQFIVCWSQFEIVCVITTSYLYVWFAAFGYAELSTLRSKFDFYVTLFFEIVFLISMVFKFITSYEAEGCRSLVNDHTKIA